MLSRRLFATGAAALAGGTLLPIGGATAQTPPAPPEVTLDRVQHSKTLRVAAFPGEAPFFAKDAASGVWSGTAVEMAKDIAATCEAKLDLVESTIATVAADLQAAKVDLAIGLVPVPKWALVLDFTRPFFDNPFGIVAHKGFHAGGWAELDKPEVKIAVENGTPHESAIKRFAPNATVIGFKTGDDALAAVQSGRADGGVMTALIGLAAIKKNRQIGEFQVLHQPLLTVPICLAARFEADRRWRDFLDVWIEYNSANQQIRDWLLSGLGMRADELPPDVEL